MSTLLFHHAASQIFGTAVGGGWGAAAGRAVMGFAGYWIDQSLLIGKLDKPAVQSHRLRDLDVRIPSEGAPIPRVYGGVRIVGRLIWATRLEERVSTSSQSVPVGKFGGVERETTTYSYFANFAVGLCEGPITRVGRIWANGSLLDLKDIDYRVYPGDEAQLPDPLIQAREGEDVTPAYRGLAYVVFEQLPLSLLGNQLPQLSFEVFRSLDGVERHIRAVDLIPGSTEFGYDTTEVIQAVRPGVSRSENRHASSSDSDWNVSLNQLLTSCPGCRAAGLVVSWFGTDLRCGETSIRPGVEQTAKVTSPREWTVNGMDRRSAHLISRFDGMPAFGGTPSDQSVLAAIADLKAHGRKVMFHPFLMMDIAADNALPDPWTGAVGQPAYPWRGRISCDPVPGGSNDAEATAEELAAQLQRFFGEARPEDFTPSGETTLYDGPDEWSFRRMILHYAHLCVLAGGVDAFLIGSELVGLMRLRDPMNNFPAVERLVTLATDVRSVLGRDTKISYAADWSDYFGYHPQDGSGDLFFHLDPFWSHDAVDFIGVNNYAPLSDWRDGEAHVDLTSGVMSLYDLDYLQGNIAGGEGYDWYYASEEDRQVQKRSPISDGAVGKPWVFRYKDLKNWWLNRHFDRIGGVERQRPTAWIPQSKPFWFTEIGCPAVDKGANQPNVFVDRKSSDSALPYFSSGVRDDFMQRRFLEALIGYWDLEHPRHVTGNNPVSALYGGPMVDPEHMHVWAWDMRPYPQFPDLRDVWADGDNWECGHWINGRVGFVSLADLVADILSGYDFSTFNTHALRRYVQGYVIDRPMSARAALEPLGLAYAFDAVERDGVIVFAHEDGPVRAVINSDCLVTDDRDTGPGFSLIRAHESDLPAALRLSYIDNAMGYRKSVVEARRVIEGGKREESAELPIVMSQSQAQEIADAWLRDVWVARESAEFVLPFRFLALEPGDIVRLVTRNSDMTVRLNEIVDGRVRHVRAHVAEIAPSSGRRAMSRRGESVRSIPPVTPLVRFLEGAALSLDGEPVLGAAVAWSSPWPAAVALFKSRGGDDFLPFGRINLAGVVGTVVAVDDQSVPKTHIWMESVALTVKMHGGFLSSATREAVLNGANLAAVQHVDGQWELLQFASAVLIAPETYALSGLLRGQVGSEHVARQPLARGACFVLLDDAVRELPLKANDLRVPLIIRAGPAGDNQTSAGYSDQKVTFSSAGLRPFSPVHLRGVRSGGDIELRWIRRGRFNADNWESADIPLGEDSERYEVDILEGDRVVRRFVVSTPRVLYVAEDQVHDWGGVSPSALSVSIRQVGDVYGGGVSLEVSINV